MVDVIVTVLISVLAFAILLPLIVFVHEYGHFKVARLCGVRVDTFSIGFGRALVSWTDKQGTVWKIAAIPLGGFVKFFGDANAASAGAAGDAAEAADAAPKPATTQFSSERDRLEAALTDEEKKVCFHFKPVWQRMLVVAAGPFANFLMAIVIFAGIFMTIGVQHVPPVVGYVAPGSPAAEAGFAPGDRILSAKGARVHDFDDLTMKVQLSAGDPVRMEVQRGTETLILSPIPERVEIQDALGNDIRIGRIGISAFSEPVIFSVIVGSQADAAGFQAGDRILAVGDTDIYSYADVWQAMAPLAGQTVTFLVERGGQTLTLTPTLGEGQQMGPAGDVETVGTLDIRAQRQEYAALGPIGATAAGIDRLGKMIDATLTYLGRLVMLKEDPRQLGGPITIAKYAGQALSAGFDPRLDLTFSDRLRTSFLFFVQIAAGISVSIGLMNLLPIPILDGGHLVYYAYEGVFGRPLSEGVQAVGFRIGMAVVGSFMIFVLVNDVIRLF